MRAMLITAFAAFAISAPSFAHAEPRNESPVGMEVRSDDGTTVLGRVASVQRDRSGRIVSADIPGLEPADAPSRDGPRVASRETDDDVQLTSHRITREQARDLFGAAPRTRRISVH